MRFATISDIHANQDALIAVFEDIEDRGIEDVICLGDVVGYGPEPIECIELVRERCSNVLMGNHDWALLEEPLGFNAIAAQAIYCHRSELDHGCLGQVRCGAHIEYLKNRPQTYERGDLLFVHASPRYPLIEYILETDVAYGPSEKIKANMDLISNVCFVGHSHRGGVMTEDYKWYNALSLEDGFDVSEGKYIVNDGSVGQPRDSDTRACYVEYDDGRVYFRRVEYDYKKTMKKIHDTGCLHSICADRLAEGR